MLYKRKQFPKDTLIDVIFPIPYLHNPSVHRLHNPRLHAVYLGSCQASIMECNPRPLIIFVKKVSTSSIPQSAYKFWEPICNFNKIKDCNADLKVY